MKTYKKPLIKIIKFEMEDVIRTSGGSLVDEDNNDFTGLDYEWGTQGTSTNLNIIEN